MLEQNISVAAWACINSHDVMIQRFVGRFEKSPRVIFGFVRKGIIDAHPHPRGITSSINRIGIGILPRSVPLIRHSGHHDPMIAAVRIDFSVTMLSSKAYNRTASAREDSF
jgi:hypothetical protein